MAARCSVSRSRHSRKDASPQGPYRGRQQGPGHGGATCRRLTGRFQPFGRVVIADENPRNGIAQGGHYQEPMLVVGIVVGIIVVALQESMEQLRRHNQPLRIVSPREQQRVGRRDRFEGFDDRRFGFGTRLQKGNGTSRVAGGGDLRQATHNLPNGKRRIRSGAVAVATAAFRTGPFRGFGFGLGGSNRAAASRNEQGVRLTALE